MKSFLMRKMMASKLKGVPQADQDKLFNMIEKHPDFFQTIALEVQEEIKKGKSEMDASMEVMKRHESALKSLM